MPIGIKFYKSMFLFIFHNIGVNLKNSYSKSDDIPDSRGRLNLFYLYGYYINCEVFSCHKRFVGAKFFYKQHVLAYTNHCLERCGVADILMFESLPQWL